MANITITGYTQECSCAHCARPLKIGVNTAERGTIGADCFVKLVARDKTRWSGNGKPSASIIKERALIIAKGLAYAGRSHGLSAYHFVFEVAA